jgi:superfamily II DNA helicase RecQ
LEIQKLANLEQDNKAREALTIVKKWIKDGFHPIVFCKYIATAKYLGRILAENLPQKIHIQVVTSELADEQRREKIALMKDSNKKLLIATDCLSEGINLQEYFTAVLHYDLPWNPNRIEQRDGRIDRYGQDAPIVKSVLLWGEDNPIDKTVLKVLIRKVREIQRSIGVSIPIGEENQSIMDAVMQEVLLDINAPESTQLQLFSDITNKIEQARDKAVQLRNIFAQSAIKPEAIEKELLEMDEAIGNMDSVESFVIYEVSHLKGNIKKDNAGYKLYLSNMPQHLKSHFNDDIIKISFDSPTPKGYTYIGRNHRFVEGLCQYILAIAFDKKDDDYPVARVSEIQSDIVSKKTTLIMFRVRNVIKEVRRSKEIIAEEMYLWGYRGSPPNAEILGYDEAKHLLFKAESIANLSIEKQKSDLIRELGFFETMQHEFLDISEKRAENLIDAHSRFKELIGGRRFEKSLPVLPPDVLGIYILLPKPKMSL